MACGSVLAGTSGGAAPRAAPFSIEAGIDLGDLFDYGPAVAFAPDGKRAAFSVASGVASKQIRLISLADGKVESFGGDQLEETWAPAWSPDGRYLAFYGRRGACAALWLWDVKGATYRETSAHVPAMPLLPPVWTKDSQRVVVPLTNACTRAPVPVEDGAAKARVKVFAANRPGQPVRLPSARPPTVDALAVMNVASGVITEILQGNVDYFRISPDGSRVAAAVRLPARPNVREVVQRLHVIDLADGHSEVLANELSIAYAMFSWSADGKSLAWVNDYAPNVGSAYIVDLRDRKSRRLRGEAIEQFAPADYEGRRPLWSHANSSVLLVSEGRVWEADAASGVVTPVTGADSSREVKELIRSADGNAAWTVDEGRSVFGIMRDASTRQEGIVRIWLKSGKVSPVFMGSVQLDSLLQKPAVSAKGERVVFLSQSASEPQALWMSGPDFRGSRRLAALSPESDGYRFGSSRLIHWTSTRGEALSGALLLPPGYEPGRRYPLVVDVYGGSMRSMTLNLFGTGSDLGMNFQILATRGYAVFQPDTPLRVGSPLEDLDSAVFPGIDAVIAQGFADPDRLAVMGQSYGGYNVISLITRSNRFRAAIAGSAQADMLSAVYGNEGKSGTSPMWAEGTSQGRMGGTPWEFPERYLANSPIWRLDRTNVPLLLVHGSADPTVPAWTSTMVFNALARLGREVEYVQYEGEGHSIHTRDNLIDLHRRMIAWLDEHLVGGAP